MSRSSIVARFGIWHDSIALYVREPVGRPLDLWLDGETRKLWACTEGGNLEANLDHKYDEMGHDYPWRYVAKYDVESLSDWARCCVHEVTLLPSGRSVHGLYSCALPDNHLLPWPHARECQAYALADELWSEVVKRHRSAIKADGRIPTPPGYVTKWLTPRQRLTLFQGLDEKEFAA